MWRARCNHDGHRTWGPQRATQEEAADDYLRMRQTDAKLPAHVMTLREALDQERADLQLRGATKATVKGTHDSHANYLLKWFQETAPMAEIDTEELKLFVHEALADGRSPNTLLGKDLPLLARCFRWAGIEDRVAATRAKLRTLKRVAPKSPHFTPEELRDLMVRMRDWRDERGKRVEAQEDDVALLHFLAQTGVRAGECGRIMLSDVSYSRRRIAVCEAKDRSHSRPLAVPPKLEPSVRLLERIARERAGPGVPDDQIPLVRDSENHIGRVCARWKKRLKEPRLSGRALRKACAVSLIASGATPTEVMAILGHRRLSTTDKYVHEASQQLDDVAERLSRHWNLLGDEAESPPEPDDETPTSA